MPPEESTSLDQRDAGTRRRLRRTLAYAAAALIPAAAASTYAGVRVLTDAVEHRRPRPTLRARFFGDEDRGEVHLTGRHAHEPGTWGLRFRQGYVRVTDPVGVHSTVLGDTVVRPFELMDGRAPVAAAQTDRRRGERRRGDRRRGDRRRRDGGLWDQIRSVLDRRGGSDRRNGGDRRRVQLGQPWPVTAALSHYAHPDDPQLLAARLGAAWSIDAVPAPGGYLPAWRFEPPGASRTWVVGVHGRGATRTELFRLVATAVSAGLPCLVVSYRTDAWTRAPAPVSTLGQTEWEDVAAAARLLLKDRARDVILAGCSLGGAIAAQVVRRSALAPYVSGVVLDAPALDWGPIVRHVARTRRIPGLLVPPVMTLARWRADVDWGQLDHLAAAADFRHPILLVHGTADEAVPVWISDAFAAARPDLVTYLRVPDAGHVEAWNADPSRYEDAVRRFLAAR